MHYTYTLHMHYPSTQRDRERDIYINVDILRDIDIHNGTDRYRDIDKYRYIDG